MSTYMQRYFKSVDYPNYSSRKGLTAQLRKELKNFFLVKTKSAFGKRVLRFPDARLRFRIFFFFFSRVLSGAATVQ